MASRITGTNVSLPAQLTIATLANVHTRLTKLGVRRDAAAPDWMRSARVRNDI